MFSGVIGFIGAGNMAQAIAFGLIDAGAISAKNIVASAPSMNNLDIFKEKGAMVTHENNEVVNKSDIIFLSIKPQYLDSAIKSLNDIPHEGKLYVSILAGVRLDTLLEKFQLHCNNKSPYKIVRVLPNTAVLVGAGCSVMAGNANTPEEDISLVKSLMSVGGSCDIIPENLVNSCSAVCGSGPAFVSRGINSKLESDDKNNNKFITFKNNSLHNSSSEPLRIPVDEKSSTQEAFNNCYREKNLYYSEGEGSDRSTTDESEVESTSEHSSIMLRNCKFEERRTSIHENSEHRFNLQDYRNYDLRQKISPNSLHDGYSHTRNHLHDSEDKNFTGINDSCLKENNRHKPLEFSRRDKTYFPRYFREGDDDVWNSCLKENNRHKPIEFSRRDRTHFPRYFREGDDDIWDWQTVNNNRHSSVSDYHVGRNQSVPYFEDNYFARRTPNDGTYHYSVHSYNKYRELNTVMNREDSRYYPLNYWSFDYSYGRAGRYSDQSYSLELVGKRKISDVDYIYSQPSVKKSRQNPAVHPLQVVIMRFNQQDSITQNMAAKIRLTLILLINSTFGSGFSPKFEATTLLKNGHFLVSCSDELTVGWLLEQHLVEEDGTPFNIMRYIDVRSMQVVETCISYNRQPVRQVLDSLKYQNPSLSTDKWLLCQRSFSKSGQLLRFFIDNDSFKCLELLNWKPYFQLCRLQFLKINIQEDEICVLCKLFSTTCSLCTSQ